MMQWLNFLLIIQNKTQELSGSYKSSVRASMCQCIHNVMQKRKVWYVVFKAIINYIKTP